MSGEADHWPMGLLGLDEQERDRKVIRRAYAAKLKQIDQAADPEGFQRLREAFEHAKRLAEWAIEDAAAEEEYQRQEAASAAAETEHVDSAGSGRIEAPSLDEIGIDVPDAQDLSPEHEEEDWDDLGEDVEDRADTPIPVAPEEQALVDRITELLDAKAAPWQWKEALDDPVLFDMEAASRIEYQIFHGLRDRLIRSENAPPRRPAFANKAWVELMDQRFGWTSDFPMFQRKFGWYAEEMLLVLAAARRGHLQGPGQPAAEYINNRIEIGRRPWLWTAGMLCAGYFAVRVFLLDLVLP